MMSIAKKWIRWAKGQDRDPPISDAMEDFLLVREAEFFRRFPRGMVLELDGLRMHVVRHNRFHNSSGFICGQWSSIDCVFIDSDSSVQKVQFDLDEMESLWPWGNTNKELDNG